MVTLKGSITKGSIEQKQFLITREDNKSNTVKGYTKN
jgi:hypothetical protein